MRETQEPHVVQNAQVAPDAEQVKFPLSAASCPSTGASTPVVSPLFEGTFVHSLHFDLDSNQKDIKPLERKRRRVIGNMDNTLDGLVAKRAELDPNSKRYQTENEAIELPDDETEMKRLETDPDVSTRMCSICGYQGKWVSEMIRHKRVHTQERPFKCKYCNRTSKWKADLIRHVAKTHGIRVVSKYSRSKAFETQSGQPEEHIIKTVSKKKDLNNNVHSSVIQKPQHSTSFKSLNNLPQVNSPSTMVYRCSSCIFEQDSMEVCVNHLRTIHNLAPFECQRCNLKFENVQLVSTHCAQSNGFCTPLQIKINFQITSPTITSQPNTPSQGLLTVATGSSNHLSLPLDSDTASSAPSSCSTNNTDYELSTQPGSNLHACTDCPYRTPTIQKLTTHRQGHQMPRGLFNYKCVFCNWFAKKKSAIEKHMQVHTSRPSQFMAQVERNLITPLTTSNLIGGASAPIQQPMGQMAASAPLSASATAFGLLSALYSSGGGLVQGSSPIAPSPMQTAPSSANLPDISAFKELTTNPLLAFSLCSLLENLNNQQTTLRSPFLPMVSGNSVLSAANLSAFDHSSHLI